MLSTGPLYLLFLHHCVRVIHATRVNRIVVVVLVDHDYVAVIELRVILTVLHSWRIPAAGAVNLPGCDRLLADVNVAIATVLILGSLCGGPSYQAEIIHRFLLAVGA